MNKRRRYRAVLVLGTVGLLLTVAFGLWLRSARRQEALNRQLIAALVKGDTKEALTLLDQGANPNSLCDPQSPPSMRQLFDHLLHRTALPKDDRPTVFLIVCGDTYENYQYDERNESVAWQVERAMLQHGANVNARGTDGFAPLFWAVFNEHVSLARALLEHGANVNARGNNGMTALYIAVNMCALEDYDSSEYISLLLKYRADPNLPANNGDTALQIAQRRGRSALAALLKQAGAKK